MNILVVTQYYYPEPFRINEICEEFVKRGHSVTVLTGRPNYPDGEIYDGYSNIFQEEHKGVVILRCKNRPRKKGSLNLLLNYISFWIKASMYIRKLSKDFDMVYSYQLSPISSSSPACWYAKKYHKPYFLYCLDIWPESIKESFSSKSPIYKCISWISKKIYSSADTIGVTSPSFIYYLSDLIQRPQERFAYIPQHARDILCKSDSIVHERLNILFTGNIGASQNLDVLVDAISHIKDEHGFKVTIVGSGSDLERLQEKVQQLGITELITFTGRQPKEKMADYYEDADICFLSLRDEGAVSWTIPGKLQEYMSAGKTILAAINGDARFVIEDAQCGVCVNYDDSVGLSKVILDFVKNKKRLLSFGHNSRAYYLKHFTLAKHVDALEKIFGSTVSL